MRHEPGEEVTAVEAHTDVGNERDMKVAETTELIEDEVIEPDHSENTVGAKDVGAASDSEDDEAGDAPVDEAGECGEKGEGAAPAEAKRGIGWSRILTYGVLPGLALLLAVAAGFLKWQDSSARMSQIARVESVAAAKDSTIAMLSYQADTAEKDLNGARNRLTGKFEESYTQLINDVVIPGSQQQHISTTATVPAVASVSATPSRAVALLFVNQTAIINGSPPNETISSVRVTLDKIDGRWLISGFEPV